MMNDIAMYRFLVENVSDGVYFVDHDRTITGWNRGATAISGFAATDVVDRRCSDGILNHVDGSGRSLCQDRCPLTATMRDGKPRAIHVWMNRADGTRLPVRVRATPVRDAGGTIVGAMEVFTDDTAARDAQARIREIERTASVDPLTGLGDHDHLQAQLTSQHARWTRRRWPFGVLAVEIDGLEEIIADHGRGVGDDAIRTVARTLVQTLPLAAVVTRSGDERFTVLHPDIDVRELRGTADRIRTMVAASRLVADQRQIALTVSVGGTLITDGDEATTVLRRAEASLDHARTSGRNAVVITDIAASP